MPEAAAATTPAPTQNGTAGPAVPASPGSPPAPATPAKPPSPADVRKAVAPEAVRGKKTYVTATGPRGGTPPAPTLGAATAQPAPSASAANAPLPAAALDKGADSAVVAADTIPAPAPTDGSTPAAAEDPNAKLDEGELAKRLGHLTRQERRFREEQRGHADKVALADAVARLVGPANARPEVIANVIQQAQMVAQGRQAAAKDPIGFLHRVFGVSPERVYQLAIDGAIAQGARPPEARQHDALKAAVQEAVAPFEQELRKAQETQKQEAQRRQVTDYQQGTLTPILQEPGFASIRQFCQLRGEDPAAALYDAMVTRFRATGRTPSPRAMAEELEPQVAAIIKKTFGAQTPQAPGGGNANPAGPATAKRAEPAQAPPDGSRRTAAEAPTRAPPLVRQRAGGPPYNKRAI